MQMATEFIYVWILSWMLFRMNPLNDQTRPESEMNVFNRLNLIGRKRLAESLREEGIEAGSNRSFVVYWHDIWPYLQPTIVTAGWLVVRAFTGAYSSGM